MKGDFSRITYNDRKHYSLVMMQQGRVQLDADWNEQAILQWVALQTLTEDLIGEHAGPGDGFRIEETGADHDRNYDLVITAGRYYVGGVLCVNGENCFFADQEDYPIPERDRIERDGTYLIYLYAWWRHITNVKDDDIREVALGGPDTATRIQNLWQVKAKRLLETPPDPEDIRTNMEVFEGLLEEEMRRTNGRMAARAVIPVGSEEPCVMAPENRYRGAENQFYRVEIHRSGPAFTDSPNVNMAPESAATFKWSRENGSVVFPIRRLAQEVVVLEHLGRDPRFGLEPGHWVEIVDDDYERQERADTLHEVVAVDPEQMQVTLASAPDFHLDLDKHPFLRRWDHVGEVRFDGTVGIEEGKWIELEDGVQIQFSPPEPEYPGATPEASFYRSGDWWWFPARTATGNVEWPQDENDEPLAVEAIGPGRRYAPLALITFEENGNDVGDQHDLRRRIGKLWV